MIVELWVLIPACFAGFGFGYAIASYQALRNWNKIAKEVNKLKKGIVFD